MIKRLIFVTLIALASVYTASAQTTVTGTVADANNNGYNGTAGAYIVLPTGQAAPLGVTAFTSAVPLTGGAFTIVLSSNFTYVFTFCSAPSLLGVPTTNPTPKQVCFTTNPIAISGTNQNITSAIGVAPTIGVSSSGSANISNQANGTIPLATAPAAIGAQSHLSESGGFDVFTQPVLMPQAGSVSSPLSAIFTQAIDLSGPNEFFGATAPGTCPSITGALIGGLMVVGPNSMPQEYNVNAAACHDLVGESGTPTPGNLLIAGSNYPDVTGTSIPATSAGFNGVIQGLTGCNTANFVYTPQAADCVAAGAVSSVFTRTGAVTAQSGDYTCAQVTNCPTTAASVVALFSTCSGTQYLGADGACHNAVGGAGGGTVTYTSSQTASSSDNGKFVIMNCSSACAYTLPATQPSTTWFILGLSSVGSTTATVALGGSDTYNGGTTVPTLNPYTPFKIFANTTTSTDYRGTANSGYKYWTAAGLSIASSNVNNLYSPDTAPTSYNFMPITGPIVVTRITVLAGVAAVSCTTAPHFGVLIGATAQSPDVSPASGNTSADSGAISLAIAAGSSVRLGTTVAESGCGTKLSNPVITVEYQ